MQPIGRRVRYPFDGKPRTREETDENGNLAFRVSAKALTPARAKIADNLGETTAAALILLAGLLILDRDWPPPALLFAASIWFLHPLFEKAWREALKRNVEMVVTAEQFRFRRWMRWITIKRVPRDRFLLSFMTWRVKSATRTSSKRARPSSAKKSSSRSAITKTAIISATSCSASATT
jgi:hypothetical protein